MRIKIPSPDPVIFTTEIPVRIYDLNYGKHLGNDSVLSLAHEARLQWLKSMGFKHEMDFGNNIGFIMTDAAVMYLGEGFYADLLEVKLGLADIHKKGFDVLYSLIRKEDQKEIARVKSGILFFDYENKKLVNVPVNFNL